MKKTIVTRLAVLLFTLLVTQSPEASNTIHSIPQKKVSPGMKPVFAGIRSTALEL